jgi:hypothetical protein
MVLALTFRPVIEGDGVGYYSFLHAIFVSHSLGFENEYAAARASGTPLYLPWVTNRENGHLTDFFPVGSAVLSSPAYLIALVFRPSGEPQYGAPFVQAFVLSSLLFGLLGLAFCYVISVSVVGDRRAALVGVAAAVFATPLVYYLLSDPSYAHTFSVFAVSAFLYLWWLGPPVSWRGWLALGVLGGIMAMTRFQDGALMLVLLVDVKKLRWPALALIPGVIIGFAPQLLVDQIQFGGWLPQRAPGQTLNPLNARYLEILFGSHEGLFIWTPAALLAGAGLFLIKERRLQLAALLALILEVLIIGSTPDPSGASVGPRRFLELTPFAVVGFAGLAARVRPWVGNAGLVAVTAWNALLLANFEYLMAPGDPGYRALTVGQIAAVQYLPRLLAKGVVVRDLLLPNQTHGAFAPLAGVTWLALEAVCVAAAVCVASRLPRAPKPSGRVHS